MPAGDSLDEVQLDGAVIDLARMTVMRGDAQVALTPCYPGHDVFAGPGSRQRRISATPRR